MSDQIKTLIITGGVGDFLQCVDIVNQAKSVKSLNFLVVTHFKSAGDFFSPFIESDRLKYHYFDDLGSLNSILCKIDRTGTLDCPRNKYLQIQDPFEVESPFDNDNEIIGIHPFGSDFAKNANNQLQRSSKNISDKIVRKIFRDDKNYLLFGSKKELSVFEDLKFVPNICLVDHDNIWVNLSHVKLCKKMIAADSAFKTLTLMRKMPTYLVVPDYLDQLRDKMFIDPYLEDGHLKLLKTSNLLENEREIIEFVEKEVYSSKK